MKKKDSSSWSEIKSLDERLARDPDSFCFARLSEVYLKVGLVADALHTARQGVAKHPGYLAGQRALAMACNANGLHEESRTLLEKVTAAVPEDTAAQKLLATLYVDAGDTTSAIRAYTTLLDFRPDDVQSRTRLEELQGADTVVTPPKSVTSSGKIFDYAEEDVYELSEDEIVHDEDEAPVMEEEPAAPVVAVAPVAEHHDPLSTLTLAELYEQQGFVAKALDIYRTILADAPANPQLQAKVAMLEQQVFAAENPPEQIETPDIEEDVDLLPPAACEETVALEEAPLMAAPVVEDIAIAEPEQFATAEFEETIAPVETPLMAAPVLEDVVTAEPEPFASAMFEDMSAPVEVQDFSPLVNNQADNVVGTLDNWLENIRRIKACR
jgi:tetratricopeptide (TPR) repeat protein